jgi:hypothetical protein
MRRQNSCCCIFVNTQNSHHDRFEVICVEEDTVCRYLLQWKIITIDEQHRKKTKIWVVQFVVRAVEVWRFACMPKEWRAVDVVVVASSDMGERAVQLDNNMC